jgi:hypothetical protein
MSFTLFVHGASPSAELSLVLDLYTCDPSVLAQHRRFTRLQDQRHHGCCRIERFRANPRVGERLAVVVVVSVKTDIP